MNNNKKYKLEAVNHDGEIALVWCSNDRDYLVELAQNMSATEVMNEFNEPPKLLDGDTIELYVDYNDDDSTRDIAFVMQFIQTNNGVIKYDGVPNKKEL